VLLRDSDQMSMAHALEVREPFLDHDLIEWVLAVSDVEKYPHFPKQLLVEAMGDLLPPEIVHRPKILQAPDQGRPALRRSGLRKVRSRISRRVVIVPGQPGAMGCRTVLID
jgi:asparagine synthetase B (glutamine-hydrolysing)